MCFYIPSILENIYTFHLIPGKPLGGFRLYLVIGIKTVATITLLGIGYSIFRFRRIGEDDSGLAACVVLLSITVANLLLILLLGSLLVDPEELSTPPMSQ